MCRVMRQKAVDLTFTYLEREGDMHMLAASIEGASLFNRYVLDHPGKPLAPLPADLAKDLQSSAENWLKGRPLVGVRVYRDSVQHDDDCPARENRRPCKSGYDSISLP